MTSKPEEKDEFESLLDEMGIEAKEVADKEALEPEVEILDEGGVAAESLDKSKGKFQKKLSDIYSSDDPNTKEKFKKRLQTYDSSEEYSHDITRIEKITPDIERVLFPYFMAGATCRSIWQQFGGKFGFSLNALYKARDFYLWKDRKKAITELVIGEEGAEIADRMKDYMSFFDDLMSEAIIRFKKNSESGRNSNPFETLKVQNVKDLKDLTELMLNIMGKKEEETRGKKSAEQKGKLDISDKKAAKLLDILAEDDDE